MAYWACKMFSERVICSVLVRLGTCAHVLHKENAIRCQLSGKQFRVEPCNRGSLTNVSLLRKMILQASVPIYVLTSLLWMFSSEFVLCAKQSECGIFWMYRYHKLQLIRMKVISKFWKHQVITEKNVRIFKIIKIPSFWLKLYCTWSPVNLLNVVCSLFSSAIFSGGNCNFVLITYSFIAARRTASITYLMNIKSRRARFSGMSAGVIVNRNAWE